MIYKGPDHDRPKPWHQVHVGIRRRWVVPFVFTDWLIQWAAFALSRFSLLEVLEYCGSFSILFAVVLYFVEAPQRQKMKRYEAWQVINSAAGKGGNGGRMDALQDLNHDRISLVGVDLTNAALEGMALPNAELRLASMNAADLMNTNFAGSDLELADLTSANLRRADFTGVNLTSASLKQVDLTDGTLRNANLSNARFDDADLTDVDFTGVTNWQSITQFQGANIHAAHGAPDGFIDWAKKHGAVDQSSDTPTTQPK